MKPLSLFLFLMLQFQLCAQDTLVASVIPRATSNALKLELLSILSSEFGIGYERKITRKFSFEIDAGPTHSGGRFSKRYGNLHPYDATTIIGKYGFMVKSAVRFYPLKGGEGLRKLYVSPKVGYCTYDTDAIDSYSETTYYEEFRNKYSSAVLNIGWQAWYTRHFGIDYYLGAGMGWASYDYRQRYTKYGEYHVSPWYNQKESYLVIDLGIKLSFGW